MNSKKIIVKDVVDNALSNASGVQLQYAIESGLKESDIVILSFNKIDSISSSFLNSSIGNIVDKYNFDILKKIRVIDYTPSILNFFRKYVHDLKLIH